MSEEGSRFGVVNKVLGWTIAIVISWMVTCVVLAILVRIGNKIIGW